MVPRQQSNVSRAERVSASHPAGWKSLMTVPLPRTAPYLLSAAWLPVRAPGYFSSFLSLHSCKPWSWGSSPCPKDNSPGLGGSLGGRFSAKPRTALGKLECLSCRSESLSSSQGCLSPAPPLFLFAAKHEDSTLNCRLDVSSATQPRVALLSLR